MENFRLTLFNGITLLMIALTLALAAGRWRGRPRSNWPLAGYAVLAAYTFGFDGSFNKAWLAFGVICAILIRAGVRAARWAEAPFFAYLLWRSAGLLLMW